MSDGEEEKKKSKPKAKEPQTFIRENEDSIVDLADPNAFSKITSRLQITDFLEFKFYELLYFLNLKNPLIFKFEKSVNFETFLLINFTLTLILSHKVQQSTTPTEDKGS